MIRAAAKNSAFAAVVVDPADYERRAGRAARVGRAPVARDAHGARGEGVRLHRPLRRRDRRLVRGAHRARASRRRWHEAYEKVSDLRYGENPHQQRRLLRARRRAGRTCSRASSSCTARSCRSTTCSTSAPPASWSRTSQEPACAIVKHNNPCGCAVAETAPSRLRARLRLRPAERLRRRDRPQPAASIAAFAETLSGQFIEVLLAPGFDAGRARAAAGEEERAPARAAPTGPRAAQRARGQAGASAASSCRPATWSARRASRCACMTAARARASSSGRTCCSPGGSAGTCAPTRS